MAKDSSLVNSNSASVVDNTSGYFAFSWSGPRIGSRYCDSSFLSKYKKCIKYRLSSWRQTFATHAASALDQRRQFSKKYWCPARDANSRTWAKYNNCQKYCSTLSTTLRRYTMIFAEIHPKWTKVAGVSRHFVMAAILLFFFTRGKYITYTGTTCTENQQCFSAEDQPPNLTQTISLQFSFFFNILLSGLSLVLNKAGLWLTKTDTQPERTQRWATWQARLDTHLL